MTRFSILGLWYALATLGSASVAANKGIDFGVLMTTDDPDRHPSVACEGESAMLQSVLDVTLMDLVADDTPAEAGKKDDPHGERKLYGKSRYCSAFCRTTLPGTCYWVAPQCYPKRRFLKDEARGKDTDTDGTNKYSKYVRGSDEEKDRNDKNKSKVKNSDDQAKKNSDDKAKNVPSSDSNEDDMADFEPVHTAQCARAILAVDAKLVLLAAMVSTKECKEALLDTKTYQCFKGR